MRNGLRRPDGSDTKISKLTKIRKTNLVFFVGLAVFVIPRLGSAFETATALGLVAIVRDDPWTLSKVERVYRRHALAAAPSAVEPARVSGVRIAG